MCAREMSATDHSVELGNLFEAFRAPAEGAHPQSAAASSSPSVTSQTEASRPLGVNSRHPLYAAVAVTSRAQSTASANARRRVRETLAALDSFAPFSPARLEGQLLLCEAELMSVSATIGELAASLEKAATACQEDGQQHPRTDSSVSSVTGASAPSPQGFQHLQEVLSITKSRNTRWRERVALCKEELALYRNEMVQFARCGVMGCEEDDVLQPSSAKQTPKPSLTHAHSEPSAKQLSRDKQPGFGLISGVAKNFMQLDSVVKGAVPMTLSSLGSATTQGIEGILASTGGAASSLLSAGGILDTLGGLPSGTTKPFSRNAAPPLPDAVVQASLSQTASSPPSFRYTPEEEARLAEQQLSLVEQQRVASAHDAKQVEASVRELSQLTSLMNEKVVEQNEHFSILMKNTTEAKNNYDKALKELHKAEDSGGRLNATRQLILILWLSSALILAVNWLVK